MYIAIIIGSHPLHAWNNCVSHGKQKIPLLPT
jgi:hypothetical protein